LLLCHCSSWRSIEPLLLKYGMYAKEIQLDSFLHDVHKLGECEFLVGNPANSGVRKTTAIPTFDDIHLFIIRLKPDL
jgi:hypothetical protein